MQKTRQIISVLLAACLLFCCAPISFAANPVFTSAEEAGVYVREQWVARKETCSFTLQAPIQLIGETTEESFKSFFDEQWEQITQTALAHTGVGYEGDYLKNHLKHCGCTFSYSYSEPEPMVSCSVTLHADFYSDAAQENAVTEALAATMPALELSGKSDAEKVHIITDFISDTVEYDYENLHDDTYTLKQSAYAALINGTAVCQGYANLFYRMALEAGLDARIITGTAYTGETTENHAWNIVQIEDAYYYVDPTWTDGTGTNQYYLQGKYTLEDHYADPEYSALLDETYPLALYAYAPVVHDENSDLSLDNEDTSIVDSGYSGDIKWTLDNNVLYLEGSGDFQLTPDGTFYHDNNGNEYFSQYCIGEWAKYAERIKKIEVNIRNCTTLQGLFMGITPVMKPNGEIVMEGHSYSSLEEVNFNNSDLSNVRSLASLFEYCPVKRINMANMDTSHVYTMFAAFSGCFYLESVDLSGWDTSNVNEMRHLFGDCNALCKVKGIEGFNTSHVTDFTAMFQQCNSLTEIDVSKWQTGSVSRAEYMFVGCRSLETINVAEWDMSNLENSFGMFSGCTGIKYIDMSKWYTPKLKNIGDMFSWCFNLSGSISFSSGIQDYKDAFYAASTGPETSFTIYYSDDCSREKAQAIAQTQDRIDCNISVIKAAEHQWNNGEITIPATCTENGIKTYTCTVCQAKKTETIKATGHQPLIDAAVQATCTADGLTEGSHCSVCGETIKAQKTVNATGHNYGAWVKLDDTQHQRICANDNTHVEKEAHAWDEGTTTKEPTADAEGEKTFICSVCNATKTEPIEKLTFAEVSDPSTNIAVSYESNAFDGKLELRIQIVSKPETLLEEAYASVTAYDISTMIGNEKTQPKAPVTVRIPLPQGYNTDSIEVYHINDEGKKEIIAHQFEDSYIVFIADSFSIYVVVDTSTKVTLSVGDVDGDGTITPADARLALRRSVNLESYAEGSLAYFACDADKDGIVTPADARLILRASVGLESLV